MTHFTQLPNYSVLMVQGLDAKKLLQGQLTCDVERLTSSNALLGAHCNPQGRVIHLFHVFLDQNAYYLLMPRRMIPLAMGALKKYAVFYKVILEEANHLAVMGYVGHQPPSMEGVSVRILDASRALIVGSAENIAMPSTPEAAWQHAEMKAGIPTLYPETSEMFLPHELNLDQLDAISFDKGCYTGQEIISRMHYRATLKNRLHRAHIISPIPPLPGQAIFYMQEGRMQPGGTVVNAMPMDADHQYHVLMVADQAKIHNNTFFLEQDPHQFFMFHKV